MANIRDLAYLDLVRNENNICCVIEVDPEPPHRGMIGVCDREYACQSAFIPDDPMNLSWISPQRLEKITPAQVSKDVLRSFFRLERSVWELVTEGCFPFDPESEPYQVTYDDMISLLRHYSHTDEVTRSYISNLGQEMFPYKPEAGDELSAMMFCLFCDMLCWFDLNEDDPALLSDFEEFLLCNEHRTIRSAFIPENYATQVCLYISNMAYRKKLTENLRELYIRILDTPTVHAEEWRLERRGYDYYGGNDICPCDWHKSAESLQQYYDLHPVDQADIANSLGYIYYSNRLGEPDYEKAFRFFSEAAEAGVEEAIYKLSDMYRKGHGTPANYNKAYALLHPLYEKELEKHQKGFYGSHLADTALRMGYCARDGIGRQQSDRDAYCFFRQAENAIQLRMIKYDGHFGDHTVEANIKKALSELLEHYSPSNETMAGLIGCSEDHRGLFRCIADDGSILTLKSIDTSQTEKHILRDKFKPLTEHIRNEGDAVTIQKGQKKAIIKQTIWHRNRGTAYYILSIDGIESGKWYFENDLTD